MIQRNELRKMSKEQLISISMEKNQRGIATPAARYAQELLGKEKYHSVKRMEDDYEGWIDQNKEEVQEIVDVIEFWNYFR